MSDILSKVRTLIAEDKFRIAAHALRELINDNLLIEPLVLDIMSATLVEEYSNYHKGPCILVLQISERDRPVHLLWGIPAGRDEPAV